MDIEYGPMVGCETAMTWVNGLSGVDDNIKIRVLRRMQYEFAKDNPVKPKFHKGRYGKKYDYFTCGKCGFGLNEVVWEFCPKCGFAIGKREYNGQTDT